MKGWVCGVLLDDASLGLGHEVEDVVDFRDLGKRFADFLQALFAQLAALVEEAVGIVDVVDDSGREAAATHIDNVDSALGQGFTGDHG